MWTAHHWQHWLARGHFPDHPWRTYLERSALTLKGLTYAPTGAVVAAATTSLPETPGGERNWDYRYSWIRDSTFALWGLYSLGFDWEANDFLYFIAEVAGNEDLQVMYGVGGERDLEEQELPHLHGYEGRGRSASATARTSSASTTCGAPCSTRSTCTPARATAWTRPSGRSWSSRWSRRSPIGRSRIAACGRCAASRSTSPRPRSCAGWPATVELAWRGCARTTSRPSAGRRSPTRSRPTCWPTGWTSAASSPSTTTPMRWTRRCCCSRWCASCRPRTSGSSRRSTPSPTS